MVLPRLVSEFAPWVLCALRFVLCQDHFFFFVFVFPDPRARIASRHGAVPRFDLESRYYSSSCILTCCIRTHRPNLVCLCLTQLVMKSIIPCIMAGVIGIYGLIIAILIGQGGMYPFPDKIHRFLSLGSLPRFFSCFFRRLWACLLPFP
jgi:hypothetical protein